MTPSRTPKGPLGPLLLVAVLVTYGSLYPFRFARPHSVRLALRELFAHPGWWTSIGDVAGNVLLFVPMGMAIVVATAGRSNARAWRIAWTAFAVALALALQIAQVFVPARSAALADVLWNGVGIAIGLLAGKVALASMPRLVAGGDRLAGVSILALAFWFLWRLWPFVPTIDLQQVKNALKPLVLRPEFQTWSFVSTVVSVLLLSALVAALRYPRTILIGITAAAVGARFFLVGQKITVSVFAGSLVGLALGLAALRVGIGLAAPWMILLAVSWYTADSLRPFEFSIEPSKLNWVPFEAMLSGSMNYNLAALCGTAFLTAVLAILGRRLHLPGRGWMIVVTVWLVALEIVQLWIPTRTSDLTVGLFPVGWWWALSMVQSPSRRSTRHSGEGRHHASDSSRRR